MNKINYQKELDKLIEQNMREDLSPSLLLHSCCAPCSSYTIEYLSQFFKITVLYYNPNISPKEEYEKRKSEQLRLIGEMKTKYPVSFLDCDYDYNEFLDIARGYELCKEGGQRCLDVKWLPSDFKKKEGYKRSIVLSKEYNLYRQNFCGCAYSKAQSVENK